MVTRAAPLYSIIMLHSYIQRNLTCCADLTGMYADSVALQVCIPAQVVFISEMHYSMVCEILI